MKPSKKNSNTALPELLEEIARHFSYREVLERLRGLSEPEREDTKVDLVVLGRFKAGKSSLINSILNKDLLPVGVLPVTAIVTRIAYGQKEKAVVTTTDNRSFEIDTDKLPEYVSESRNPENKKQVALADLYTPALERLKNIRIIDTPGLGSAFKHNTEETRKWYNRIGAALVVMNSTQSCSEEDRDLIETALDNSPMVYLVLSKSDLLSRDDLREVTEFVKKCSREHFGKELTILDYSVKKEEKHSKETLFEKVLLPLENSYEEAIRTIYDHKLERLKKITLSYLNITLSVRQKEADERDLLKEKILGEQLKLNEIKQELRLITENYKEKTRKTLEKKIVEKYKNQLTRQLVQELKENKTLKTGNLHRVSRQYEQWLKEAVDRNLRHIETEVRPEVNTLAARAGQHITNYCNAFRDRLNHNLQKVLGVTMPDDTFIMEPDPVEKPDILTSWAFESHIDLIWFLFPMFLFRKAVLRHFEKQLPPEAEKNLYRLTAQFSRNVNHIIDLMHLKAVDYITKQLTAIESLLTEKGTGTGDIVAFLKKMEELS